MDAAQLSSTYGRLLTWRNSLVLEDPVNDTEQATRSG